jgi:hypothetical protein
MHDEDVIEEPTTRAGFVKKLGKMVAIGLGVALVPATEAFAVPVTCCRNTSFCDQQSQCGQFHNPQLYGYLCPSNPCASCCTCLSNPNLGCPTFSQCPC